MVAALHKCNQVYQRRHDAMSQILLFISTSECGSREKEFTTICISVGHGKNKSEYLP